MKPLLFKVLVNGQSCHGGTMTWSLPKDGSPGKWHESEVEPQVCSQGLHLTDSPANWWKNGATAYVVEAEGVVGNLEDEGRKVAAKRVRLLREATEAELAERNIFLKGLHSVNTGSCIAYGSASVRAYGSASVRAYDSARVTAYDSASVEASGSASVTAYDSASVEASGSARVEASGSASVSASDSARVEASGSASVRAYDSARVTAYDSASVEASGSASVTAYDSASVEASGSASVRAYGSARVTAYDSASVEASGKVVAVSYGGSPTVVLQESAVHVDQRGESPKVTKAKKGEAK
jgi:hypothetical protein